MNYDYKNRKITFDSPAEEADRERHMAEFGPATGKSHPDDCPYCAARGWKTFPGTSFKEECDKWAAEHPDEVPAPQEEDKKE